MTNASAGGAGGLRRCSTSRIGEDLNPLSVLASLGGLALLVWTASSVVKHAKRGGKRNRAIGATLMLIGWANLRDPRNDTVAEAQDGRIRKGTESGDPPN